MLISLLCRTLINSYIMKKQWGTMFKKILVANRGEIALRVMRSAREMGIATVAVFSDSDRLSPHVFFADEAYPLNGLTSAETYLDAGKILAIAQESGTDAIHPGYGFLSENVAFSERVTASGITFIGPDPYAIRVMGDKTAARQAVAKFKVPIVPGLQEPISDVEKAVESAAGIGFPLLVKAAGGGGGKGMHIVNEVSELRSAILKAQREAASAFGDDRVYLERYIASPHHIEIQILADNYGRVIHLNERECSVQRRYQKIIEETPSPLITPEMRFAMGEAAVQAARSCHYSGAGTIEFLADEQGHFYFLEMNTRLQVEHPVTEMVTGIDLVKEQIRIAAAEKLRYEQADIYSRGHSIEARIYAEDGAHHFIPSTGTIHTLSIPNGPGIRFDGAIQTNSEVMPYFDPMLGKLVVWAEDREAALRRMDRALLEFRIIGIDTSIPFCRSVINHPDFIKGKYTTHFIQDHLDELLVWMNDDSEDMGEFAAIAASVIDSKNKESIQPRIISAPQSLSGWTLLGRRDR